jgi:excisionase family DNA binding protein
MDLTVNEVAERLNVTPLTVRRWLNAGALSGTMRGCEVASRNDRPGQPEHPWTCELIRG